jgi:hypothetical protein
MINIYLIFASVVVILIYTVLILSYGIRIGRAMQKDIPPVPLAVPVEKVTQKVADVARKGGKKVFRLITNIKEAKAFHKEEKKSGSVWD